MGQVMAHAALVISSPLASPSNFYTLARSVCQAQKTGEVAFGEKLVMRIFDPDTAVKSVEALGFAPRDVQRWSGLEPGFNQTQVQPALELGFAEGLRALMWQDPDIIMVGEIRDLKTAEMAVQAALTGHLVFATLHTNDSPSAITQPCASCAWNYPGSCRGATPLRPCFLPRCPTLHSSVPLENQPVRHQALKGA